MELTFLPRATTLTIRPPSPSRCRGSKNRLHQGNEANEVTLGHVVKLKVISGGLLCAHTPVCSLLPQSFKFQVEVGATPSFLIVPSLHFCEVPARVILR